MPELRKALAEAGFDDVRTYVQSGNVVLSGGASSEAVARWRDCDVEELDDGHEAALDDGRIARRRFVPGYGRFARADEVTMLDAYARVHQEEGPG